eukprot:1663404-Pleurochrysis_carterae.AAC.1
MRVPEGPGAKLRFYTAQLRLGSRHQALGLKLPVRNHTDCVSASKPLPGSTRATVRCSEGNEWKRRSDLGQRPDQPSIGDEGGGAAAVSAPLRRKNS